jgi:hypothetical protein
MRVSPMLMHMHYPSVGNAQMNQDDKKLKGIACFQYSNVFVSL